MDMVPSSMVRRVTKPAGWFVLTQHWLSLVGLALIATAVISWLFVLPLQLRGHVDNPYIGIIVFLILPVVFFTGLLLVPIGVYLSKRQIQKGLTEETFDRKSRTASAAVVLWDHRSCECSDRHSIHLSRR